MPRWKAKVLCWKVPGGVVQHILLPGFHPGHAALKSKSALLESPRGGCPAHPVTWLSSRTCRAGKQKCSAGKSPGGLSSTSCYLAFIPDMPRWKATVLCWKVPGGTVQHTLLPRKYSAGKLTPFGLYNIISGEEWDAGEFGVMHEDGQSSIVCQALF